MNESQIFARALKLATPAERAAYLDEACGGDEQLRADVEALLRAQGDDPGFLEKPAASLGGTEDVAPRAADGGEQAGVVLAGKYKLVEEIGEGGMGTVWMARQIDPVKRLVAVKLIKAGMDTKQVLARFEQERQALAMMDHPNIAKVLDAGTTGESEPGASATGGADPLAYARGSDRRPFFVMELVKGVPITRYCDEHRLTPRQRLELFIPVCNAVQHAHQKGIIHRDLKPSNVLVAPYDGRPVVKVIDFGVAKAAGQPLTDRTLVTGFGSVVGTLEYMSPEQAELNNQDIDTRSDVYALGVLLYELLTGTTPLTRDRLKRAAYVEMLRMIREEEPPRPSTRLSDSKESLPAISAQRQTEPAKLARLVRGELDWIVMKALDKDRARRYETATGFAADVGRYLADEPVQACPPTVGYRLRKFARKHRAILVPGAAFVVLLLAATAVSSTLAVWATRAEADAVARQGEAEEAGEAAKAERDAADEERKKARRTMDRLTVAEGVRRAAEGDLFGALPLLVRPLELGGLSDEEEKVHRTRVACFLRHTPGRPTLRHMLFHDGPVDFTAWSADARRLLAVRAGVVTVWDVRTGETIATLQHPEGVTQAQFTSDGSGVVTVLGRTFWLWDVATGRPIGTPFTAVEAMPEIAMLSLPHSTWQVVGMLSVENAVVRDRDRIHVALSPDREKVFVNSGCVNCMYEIATRRKISEWQSDPIVDAHLGDAYEFSSDGRRILLRTGKRFARVFDTETGVPVGPTITFPEIVGGVRLNPDGRRIGAFHYPGLLSIWDATSGDAVGSPSQPIRGLWEMYASPDSRLLAMPGDYLFRSVVMWDQEAKQLIPKELSHHATVRQIGFRKDSRQILTSADDGTVKRWWAGTGLLAGPYLAHRWKQKSSSFCPTGHMQITTDEDGVICLWELTKRNPTPTPGVVEWYDKVPTCRTAPIVTSSNPPSPTSVAPHEALLHARLAVLPHRLLKTGLKAALCPDGRCLITVENESPEGQLWDASTGQPIGKSLRHDSPLAYAEFSPDSRFIVSVDQSETTRLWDARTGRGIGHPLRLGDKSGESMSGGGYSRHGPGYLNIPIMGVDRRRGFFNTAFSPDSKYVVSRVGSSSVGVWRTEDGEPVGRTLTHAAPLYNVTFSPHCRKVGTCSEDRSARIWDTVTGQPLSPPLIHQTPVVDVAFSPDGLLFMTAEEGANIRIWDPATFLEILPPQRGMAPPPAIVLGEPTFRFTPDGRGILDAESGCRYDLTPDSRPTVDLVRLSQLYSGHRLDPHGGVEALTVGELRALWTDLRTKFPDEFKVSQEAGLEWRVNELQGLDAVKDSFAAAYHYRWLARELTEAGWSPGLPPADELQLSAWKYRLFALARHGRHAEATAAATTLAARSPKDATKLYDCARVHALAAAAVAGDAPLAEKYAGRAVALLNQAVAAGYNDSRHIRQDPDLAALRPRKDFNELLRKLPDAR